MLVLVTIGNKVLLRQDGLAIGLLRRVTSRRRARCELGLVRVMIRLLHRDKGLYDALDPGITLRLKATLKNVT